MSYSKIKDNSSKLDQGSASFCSEWNIRQMLIDAACGLAATFLQFVFTISFAAGCFSTVRTSPLFGCGVVMAALSAIITQMYAWRSDIPYLFVSPDGFYIPLVNSLAVALSNEVDDDEIFQHTFLCAIVVTTCAVGFAKFLIGAYNLMQFTDYIPYPAICGLMAGIGINLLKVGFRISMNKETHQLSYSIIIPAILFAIVSVVSAKLKLNISKSFLSLLFTSFFIFYTYVFLFRIPTTELYSKHWVYSSQANLKHLWIYSYNEVFISSNRNKIDWNSIYNVSDQILSTVVLMVMKNSLMISAHEKALQIRFDKSKELAQYGIATIISGLFGAVSTTPSLSVLTFVVDMGGSERAPGIITPLLLLLAYFTNFQCISLVPKFVLVGLLLTSGYSMVMAWLVAPMYRIPRAESLIIIIIIAMYFSKGMLFAMGVGAALSVILFIFQFHEISCIKFISSGSIFHSTEERSDSITMRLKKYRHKIVIFQLQGYLTFSNSSQLLDAIIFLLELFDNEVSPTNNDNQDKMDGNIDDNESSNVISIADTVTSASGFGLSRRLSIRRMSLEMKSEQTPDAAYHSLERSPSTNGRARLSMRLSSSQSTTSPNSSIPLLGINSSPGRFSNSNADGKGAAVNLANQNDAESNLNEVTDRPFSLILHMNDVVGCDASGMDTFSQIVRLCQSKNCLLQLAAVSDKDKELLQKSGILSSKVVTLLPSLDDALRSSEDLLIEHYKLDLAVSPHCHVSADEHAAKSGFLRCLALIQDRYPKVEIFKLECLEQYCASMDFSPGQTITSSAHSKKALNTDEYDAPGLFFLDCGVIKHLVSIESDDGNHNPYLFKSSANSHSTSQTQQKMCSLELFPDPDTSSWGSKHGPGWVFDDFDSVRQSIQDRDINVYCAHTACKVYHISSAGLKKALLEHPEVSTVLMQLQLAVVKHQLASATEQLSNLADVLHFKSVRQGQQEKAL